MRKPPLQNPHESLQNPHGIPIRTPKESLQESLRNLSGIPKETLGNPHRQKQSRVLQMSFSSPSGSFQGSSRRPSGPYERPRKPEETIEGPSRDPPAFLDKFSKHTSRILEDSMGVLQETLGNPQRILPDCLKIPRVRLRSSRNP